MGEGWKRLLFAWSVMALATGAAIFVGHAGASAHLDTLSIGALLGLAFFKASMLLSEYLELRGAPRWNGALRLSIFLLLAAIFALSVASRPA
ncbi:MAG: hypothetical protein CTY36_00960 [Methylocystis sp.]|nr:MAG: hypothetical protein CTY36_00960 [Methylocystis sp.]